MNHGSNVSVKSALMEFILYFAEFDLYTDCQNGCVRLNRMVVSLQKYKAC